MTAPEPRLRFWQGRRCLNFGHAADLEQAKPIRQLPSRLRLPLPPNSGRLAHEVRVPDYFRRILRR